MNSIVLKLNGKPVAGSVEPRTHLADFLRETLNLTGAHLGCEHGVCGACTLLIDGAPARSCITYAVMCDGAEITTIEGLDEDEITRELRAAFKSEHALQCGYCTPGMLISARDIVMRFVEPDESDIRVAMSGNLCRCTGYVGIIHAVQSVIVKRRAGGVKAISGGGRNELGPVGSGHATAADGQDVSAIRKIRAPPPGWAATEAELKSPAFDPEWKPQASFDQVFVVPHPRESVWEFFGRLDEVAACLPGAALAGTPFDQLVEGQIRVRVGPISAEFRGVAALERDHASYTGRIRGSGSDVRTRSMTRGEVRYKLLATEDAAATRVEVTIGYSLTGLLAQVGRSGLIREVAGRLTATFAENVSKRLDGAAEAEAPGSVAELHAGSLLLSILSARVKALVGKLIGR